MICWDNIPHAFAALRAFVAFATSACCGRPLEGARQCCSWHSNGGTLVRPRWHVVFTCAPPARRLKSLCPLLPRACHWMAPEWNRKKMPEQRGTGDGKPHILESYANFRVPHLGTAYSLFKSEIHPWNGQNQKFVRRVASHAHGGSLIALWLQTGGCIRADYNHVFQTSALGQGRLQRRGCSCAAYAQHSGVAQAEDG